VSAATASLPLRDPAARARLGALVAAIVVLWPLLVLAEFRPAALFEAGHLQVMGDFLRGFLPPSTAPAFLRLLGRATLETLAIATAGIALAFVVAAPLAVLATRALAVSRIGPGPGR
jgi:phosphonate transport system permease protein